MKDPEYLCNAAEGIVSLYESKVKIVTSLMREVAHRIRNYRMEQEQTANRLKELLAKNECLRNTDLDTIIAVIQSRQEAREKEVDQIVEDFRKEEEEIAVRLEAILAGKSIFPLDEFVF